MAINNIAKRASFEFNRFNPVTNVLGRNGLTAQMGARAFGGASLLAERSGFVTLSDQFHRAQLRLETPDVTKISTSGVDIGRGIVIRTMNPDEFGDISRSYYDHVAVFEIKGARSGLHAFIALHSLIEVNGRLWAFGGTRMRNDYASHDHALRDDLRLSRAMTYKCAAADIASGGSKGLIFADPKSPNRVELLQDYGRAIEYLKSTFTGQDMNISPEDAITMGLIARHSIVGPSNLAMRGEPPTPPTAKGVFFAIEKAAELHGISMNRLTVSLQGLGGVGSNLVPYLIERGVTIVATDVNPASRAAIQEKFGGAVTVLENPEAIYDVKAQVFSPSAKEDVLHDETIRRINQSGIVIVAGAANNPLRDDVRHAEMLKALGISYYRDYVVNGGGLMGVASGVFGYDPMVKVQAISGSVERLHQLMVGGLTGHDAGEKLAEERMASWRRYTSSGWI